MGDPITKRIKTISWEDPARLAAAASKMGGLEFVQAIAHRDLPPPPVAQLIDMDLIEVSEGRSVFTLEPGEHHYNPIGTVHGGIISTVLDSALGCAVQSSLPKGSGYTTVELHVNLVKAVTSSTGMLRCEGEVIHVGGRVATAQARLTDEEGRLYAHATTTCLIFRS